jgi:DeoR/GlpR family transcriptional regulator of sugar metabolism
MHGSPSTSGKGAEARHAKIMGLVGQRGFFTIEKLAQQVGVA